MCTRDLRSCSPNKMSCGGVSKALNVSQSGGRRQTFMGMTNTRRGRRAWRRGGVEGGNGEREMGTDRNRVRQKDRDRKTETDRGRQADKQAERNTDRRKQTETGRRIL